MASSRRSSQSQRPTSVSTSEIEARPWQYIGYKHYSELITSTDEFFIVRRFSALNGRVILHLQHEIVKLEARLRELDDENPDPESGKNNGSFEYDEGTERAELLTEIQMKLYRYNKVVLQQTRMRKYKPAPKRDIKSLRRWHKNWHNAAIEEAEQAYLNEKNEADLFCLASSPSDKEPLRRLIDHSQVLRTLSIWRDAEKQEPQPGCEIDGVLYFSDTKIDRFVSFVIAAVGLVMLVTPVWALHALGENMTAKLVTITVFVLVCLAVVSFAMVAKPFEALGTTAAYAAVLMVFLQLGSQASP
ncbi:hypothetical protein QBC34DRAFT_486995 [Podospora aff. communis PSN243]|uniref:DUF6594 domain-containing protein n=1 Tax=Podospora aff. communis PSN243 TaxID=3040156 RepID=A0AAV9GD72_9PEZI|nr:hypothetical protein QBC34DRAFT_486995 [Podospora aff. communis PSN243]